jgi:hypothetical protein
VPLVGLLLRASLVISRCRRITVSSPFFFRFFPSLPFPLPSSPPGTPARREKQLDFRDGDPFDDEYDDDESDGADGDAVRHYGAEHVLLLFDCDASMFERYVPCHRPPPSANDDEDVVDGAVVHYSPMDVATTAAHRLLRAKVRDVAETKSGKRDGVGVLLYGCDPRRRGRNRIRREGDGDGDGDVGGGRGDRIDDDNDDDDDDGGDDDPLPTTHELIELAAPGTEQVLIMQECIPNDHDGRRRRDLRYEYSRITRGTEEGDGPGGILGEGEEEVCSLRRGLTAALKIFNSAK